MARIRIEFEIDDDYVDESHSVGITEEAYDKISEFVVTMGSDLEVEVVG